MSFLDIGTLTARKADTLAYTQAEVNDIIAKYSSNSINFASDNSALTQRLEFLSKKEVNLQLHSDTLIEYLKVKRIPRGLRLGIKPTICKEDQSFCKNWDRILNKCSLDLMTLTIEGIQVKLSKLRSDIIEVNQKLQSISGEVNLPELKEKLIDTLDKYKSDLLKIKLDKFKRDTVDYQEDRVYNWRRPFFRQRNRSETRSIGSDSGSSVGNSSASSVPFLDRGQGGEREGGEGATARKGIKNTTPLQITTRKKRK
ncbi:hypothetical protein XELAEV_18033281mg [Xenopus laevis]|uniref:Uncharacterized protein n=1 Tax=Xenopus laevis TaxID=8355 RepID=A0A974CKH8_XENLA|nr:hypothetical protein XELAEV_18033281mg [Xenopus laevis]